MALSSFREMLLEEVVKPALNSRPKLTIGTVINYYKETNTADVYLLNANGLITTDLLPHVPVSLVNGLNHCGPFPGQRVLIDFIDGQHGSPVIVGVVERAYDSATREHTQTHRRRGAFLPDALSERQFKWTASGPGWGSEQ